MQNELYTVIHGPRSLARQAGGHIAALGLIALATLAGLLIAPRWGSGAVALLYIPPVLVAALTVGLWPALATATLSTLAYNFYFTRPYHSFQISNPADVMTVAVLFLVALVTSRLAASIREQSRRADSFAARNATIAGLARRLLSCSGEQQICDVAASQLAALFACQAVIVIRRDDMVRAVASAPVATVLGPGDEAAAASTIEANRAGGRGISRTKLTDWQFHPITSDNAVLAAAGLAREDGTLPIGEAQLQLLGNLLDQVALALVRARLEDEARDLAALRERDRLRTALLTSIGEDVKPRLNSIAAAARALRRVPGSDRALVTTVASQAAHLDRYIDGLVDLSPGEEQEPIVIGPLSIDLHRRLVARAGEPVHLTPKEYAVLAELAKHAGRVLSHAHLLRSVWGPAQQDNIDYLRVAIRALRQKLERDAAHPELIFNEPAVGYRLATPASQASARSAPGRDG
jgi:K+-sensing histidine kinase KdpD